MTELKPCPFCGGSAWTFLDAKHWLIRHKPQGNCPIGNHNPYEMVGYATKEQAIDAWNTRPAPAGTSPLADRIRQIATATNQPTREALAESVIKMLSVSDGDVGELVERLNRLDVDLSNEGLTDPCLSEAAQALASLQAKLDEAVEWLPMGSDEEKSHRRSGSYIFIRGRNSAGARMVPVSAYWTSKKGVWGWYGCESGTNLQHLISDVPSGECADFLPVSALTRHTKGGA